MDTAFYKSIRKELVTDILPYWENFAYDSTTEGFFGYIDNGNNGDGSSVRSLELVAGYLWSFSAAARLLHQKSYMITADRAFQSLKNQYYDKYFGGYYNSIKPDGTPVSTDKSTHAEAIALYALCEYAAAVRTVRNLDYPATVVMDRALSLYSLLEHSMKDKEFGGYCETADQNWQIRDTSAKSVSREKSLRTCVAILDAYTNLHRNLPIVYPGQQDLKTLIANSVRNLLTIVTKNISAQDGHFATLFDNTWQNPYGEISFGFDMQTASCIWDAANEISADDILSIVRPLVIRTAGVVLSEGFDRTTGGVAADVKNSVRTWSTQASALLGFFNIWELSGVEDFKLTLLKEWGWITGYQKDKKNGEWFYSVNSDGTPITSQPKGGNEKSCIPEVRCLLEILQKAGAI
jgi:mannobiose 2-epimerase